MRETRCCAKDWLTTHQSRPGEAGQGEASRTEKAGQGKQCRVKQAGQRKQARVKQDTGELTETRVEKETSN
ncbi:hypothetical protein Pmani_026651 [Petrolisthes manimaculis]|uniref:Uncharacterized protein n=1 Tax=Petrolisthes manimaculis TaxID=1843537 RepID=A0AAE1P494_9EUCA|nr:hypothetical protein Pmani_026651 [Petrolisthes manimaculis]